MPKPVTVTTPSDLEIGVSRVFDAPAELVWACHTKPELVRRWMLGPPGWSMPVCEIDLRVGGAYRYVWRGEDGREFGVHGVYRETVPPERLVHTEFMGEDESGGGALVTWTLSEQDGKTTLECTMLMASKEARDGVLATGMTDGVAASYDRLAELVATR